MTDNTIINFITSDTVLIQNLYYDLKEKQFVINHNSEDISRLSWHGRRNPNDVGKPIIYQSQIENINIVKNITIGNEDLPTVFLARRYSPHNFGHLMCETAIPIEYVFNLLGIKNKKDRAIIFDDCSWDGFDNSKESSIFWFEGDDIIRRRQCDLHSNNTMLPLADNVIFNFTNYVDKIYDTKKCVDTIYDESYRYLRIKNKILFGIGNISPWLRLWKYMPNLSESIDSYVDKVYDNHLPLVNYNSVVKDTITFIVKIGRRSVLNYKEIGEIIKKYADDNELKYEQFNLEDISFSNKLEILTRTKILITNGGSSSFDCFFLSKSTQIIYFPILNNNFETELFCDLNRFRLILYEQYDHNWKENIKQEDGSYLVDLKILRSILEDTVSKT